MAKPVDLTKILAPKLTPHLTAAPVAPPSAPTAAQLQQARRALYLKTVSDVRAGHLTEAEGGAKLQAAGFPAADNPFVKDVGGGIAHGIQELTAIPGGLYHAVGSVGSDLTAAATHPLRSSSIYQGLTGGPQPKSAVVENVIKPLVAGTKAVAEHPLRDPVATGLTVWGLASAGLGTAGRLGAAGRAVAEDGTLVSRAGAVGKALTSKPIPKPRTLKLNDLQVHPLPSTNPLMRAAQSHHDKVMNTSGKAPVLARPFVRTTIEKRVGHELVQRGRIVDAAANAPATALHNVGTKGKTLSRLNPRSLAKPSVWHAQQMAMKVAAEGKPIADQIRLEKTQIAKLGNGPAARVARIRHAANIRILKASQKHLDESSGKPVIRPGPLADQYARTKKVATSESDLLQRIGALTPESAALRPHLPGQVVEGASYVKPTPAKLGKPSTALLTQRAYVTRLETLHGRAVAKAAEKAVPLPNVHTRTGYVKRNLFGAPEKALARQHTEVAPGPKTPGVPSAMPAKGANTPITERLGAALSVARDRLDQMERAAANRVKPTGMVGSDFQGGDFRVPSQAKRPPSGLGKPAESVAVPKAPGTVTHPYTGALKLAGKERHDTARLVAESALEANKYDSKIRLWENVKKAAVAVPPNLRDYVPVRLDLLKSDAEFQQLTRTEQIRMSSARRQISQMRDLPEDSVAATALERAGSESRMRSFLDRLLPDIHGKEFDDAAKAHLQQLHDEGKIGWVHHELADALKQQSPLAGMHAYIARKGPIVKIAAGTVPAINRASKAAILYLKPAYAAPNILGNVALNLVEQGFAAPFNLARSATLNARLEPDALAALDNVMGEGFAAALHDAKSSVGAQAINRMANLWGKGVDTPFRRAAFLHEAYRLGYKTDTELTDLLLNPAKRDDLVHAAQRANRSIIDYGRIGPLEREIVKHVVFFYPWVKGSTLYAGHFLTEHPTQALAAADIGNQQISRTQRELGAGPSYLAEAGLFKTGGTSGTPMVSNPQAAAILGTPAELAQSALDLFSSHPTAPSLLQNLTPAVGSALAAFGTHRDPLTDRQLTGSPLSQFKGQLVNNLPQVTLARRLKQAGGDQSNKLFPMSKKTAIEQFVGGSAFPKPMNEAKYLSLGEAQRRSELSRAARIVYDHKQARATLLQQAKKHWPGILQKGRLPAPWQQAIAYRQARLSAYDKAGLKAGQPHYEQSAYDVDVAFLHSLGKITAQQAARGRAWAANQDDNTLKYQRMRLNRDLLGGGTLSYIKKALRERGGDVTRLPW